jgi:hypothetical protein
VASHHRPCQISLQPEECRGESARLLPCIARSSVLKLKHRGLDVAESSPRCSASFRELGYSKTRFTRNKRMIPAPHRRVPQYLAGHPTIRLARNLRELLEARTGDLSE